MDKKDNEVSYIVHEGILARMERINKRLWITVLLLIILLVGSNLSWIYYDHHYARVMTVTQKVDTTKDSKTYINGTGGVEIKESEPLEAE